VAKSAGLPNRFDIPETKLVDLTEMLVTWRRQIVVRVEEPVGLSTKADPASREITKFALPYSLSGLLSPLRAGIKFTKPLSRRGYVGRVKEELDAAIFLLTKKRLSVFVFNSYRKLF